MKRIFVVTIAAAIIAMLVFPSMLFAEEGDANYTVGVKEQVGQAGKYVLGEKDPDTSQPNDTPNDNSIAEKNNGSEDVATGDGDTEVLAFTGYNQFYYFTASFLVIIAALALVMVSKTQRRGK